MTSTQRDRLAPALAARAQQRHRQQRGGRARRATGTLPSTPLLDDAARLLITLCYQRPVCSMTMLADLLEVTATCIGDTVNQTREALQDHSHPSGAAPVRFPTAQALHAFQDTDTRPTRTQIHKAAVPPSPDQNQPPDLQQLTERLAPRQPAQAERLSYQRPRGRDRPAPPAALPPEDQQPRTRPCGRPLPAPTVHDGRPRRPARGLPVLDRQRHPPDPPAPRTGRAHIHTGTNPLPHRHRTPGLGDALDRPREHRHVDTLIPYGFTSSETSWLGCLEVRRRWWRRRSAPSSPSPPPLRSSTSSTRSSPCFSPSSPRSPPWWPTPART